MNKSVCENCIPKCTMYMYIPSEKKFQESRFFQAGLPEQPLDQSKVKSFLETESIKLVSRIEGYVNVGK